MTVGVVVGTAARSAKTLTAEARIWLSLASVTFPAAYAAARSALSARPEPPSGRGRLAHATPDLRQTVEADGFFAKPLTSPPFVGQDGARSLCYLIR